MKLQFGDVLYYISPETGMKTKCVFIRGTESSAVVMFKIANRVAYVGYDRLAKAA